MRPCTLLVTALLLSLAVLPVAATPARLDPGLRAAALPGAPPVPVWAEFTDKGERGPGDLVAKLAAAEAALTPESRRRREKCRVTPLVDWLDLPIEPSYVQALRDAGFEPYGASRWFNRVAVHAGGGDLLRLAALPFVRRVAAVELAMPRQREEALRPAVAPRRALPAGAQALYGQTLEQLARLNVPAVHDSGYIGTAINVCMLDDGFNWYRKHEALRTIPVGTGRTRDFVRGGPDVQDTVIAPFNFEHGTATLSALAGRKSGTYLAPAYGCNAILGRTEDDFSEKPIEMVYWTMGAEWADSLGADIISSSLGYNLFPDSTGTDITYPMLDGHTTIITRAAEIAAAKGILVVVSAGNDGNNARVGRKIGAPADANGDSVLAIAAVDSLGARAGFSSKGPTADGRIKPDLAAQGVQTRIVLAGSDPNLYTTGSGTSFAAPLVAGLAACLMQARPTWPPALIIQALKRTASHASSPDTLTGWGIPDGLAALRYVPDTLHVPELRGPLALGYAGANPFRHGGPVAHVTLTLGSETGPAHYRVRLYDAGGRVVRELASGVLAPGSNFSIPWQGDDAHGRALVPGLYFLALDGANRHGSARVIVLR